MTEPQTVNELLKALFKVKQKEVEFYKRALQDQAWTRLKHAAADLRVPSPDLRFELLTELNGAIARALWAISMATPVPEPTPAPAIAKAA